MTAANAPTATSAARLPASPISGAWRAGIPPSNTVVRFENGKHKSNEVTKRAIKAAFEAAGVRFEGGGVFPPEEASE